MTQMTRMTAKLQPLAILLMYDFPFSLSFLSFLSPTHLKRSPIMHHLSAMALPGHVYVHLSDPLDGTLMGTKSG